MVTVEEYLHTSYEPEMEYVDGRLVDRHVGEYFHSRTQGWVASALGVRERGFLTFIALRIHISDSRYRVPDVCVKALPHAVTPILTQPDLAIEILSPDEDVVEILDKIGDYHRAGIRYIWLVDPYRRTLAEANHGDILRVSGLVLETPLVGPIDFAPLFQEFDVNPE